MTRYKFRNQKYEHLHELDGKPLIGTSGVGNVLAKPLTWWASGLAVQKLGVHDPKILTKRKKGLATEEELKKLHSSVDEKLIEIKIMATPAYLDLLDSAYRAHDTSMRDSGKKGTDLHAELERYTKDQVEGITDPIRQYDKRITPFIDWYKENVKTPLWSEMHCYSEKHWLGGISDFGFVDKIDRVAIMDFKSSKEAYPSQFWQCAGYDIQISENGGYTPSGSKIFDLPKEISYYAVFPFGMDKPSPFLEFDVGGCKDAFLAMLLLYKKLPKN